jgi:hypothetical protein
VKSAPLTQNVVGISVELFGREVTTGPPVATGGGRAGPTRGTDASTVAEGFALNAEDGALDGGGCSATVTVGSVGGGAAAAACVAVDAGCDPSDVVALETGARAAAARPTRK